MSYLCKKAVKLFGKPYQPGDIIPTESVLSTRVRALITCGYIADAPAAEATEEPTDHNDEPKEVKTEAKCRACGRFFFVRILFAARQGHTKIDQVG